MIKGYLWLILIPSVVVIHVYIKTITLGTKDRYAEIPEKNRKSINNTR